MTCKIFRLGRLEFEKMESPWEIHAAGWEIRKGHPVISVHIPQGEKLTPQAAAHSLEKGKSFWGDELPYLCHSWLLYPGLKEVLSQTSNILQFQNYFQIVDIDFAEKEAEWRIFGKVEEIRKNIQKTPPCKKGQNSIFCPGKNLETGWEFCRNFEVKIDKNGIVCYDNQSNKIEILLRESREVAVI